MLGTNINNDKGFSLLEILVALFLVTFVLSTITTTNFTARQSLDEDVNSIERAIRFSVDEATIRNRMIRIHFNMEKVPVEYSVEYGPSDSFVIPKNDYENQVSLSLSDQEKKAEQTKKINKKFNKITEFESGNRELSDRVKLIGVATTLEKNLTSDFHASIYMYPTSEKDGAIMIFGTDEEVVALTIDPFTNEFNREYVRLDLSNNKEISEAQREIATELFNKWQRK